MEQRQTAWRHGRSRETGVSVRRGPGLRAALLGALCGMLMSFGGISATAADEAAATAEAAAGAVAAASAAPEAEAAAVEAPSYEAGVHYEALLVPVRTDDPAKIDVVEVFSYMCIHCFNFDDAVAKWSEAAPADVAFRREPAIFNRSWAVLAQAFYTAEALGLSDKTHHALFDAIHNKGQNMADPELLSKLFTQLGGIDENTFAETFNSFSVRSKVEQANTRGRQYRVSAVPSMIVNGKYRVEGRMAGSNAGMLRIVDFLVDKEREAIAAAAASAASNSDAAR